MAGRMAARVLALEFAKLWAGDEDCALPQRITSVSRQGVSYTILDQQDFLDELKTGLYVVDLFLKSVNPDKARAKARVFSVDVPRGRRYTPKALVYTADATKDITIQRSTTGTITIPLADIEADFFITEENWTPSVTVRNWSQTKAKTLDSSVATINEGDETITITIPYSEVIASLGMSDPGTYDLYGVRPSEADPSIDEIVLITSANLKVSTLA
jgi:hypothetical protein